MSRIQRILERAERDGAIPPAAAPVPLGTPPASGGQPVTPPHPLPAAPAVESAPANRRKASGALAPALDAALRPGSTSAEQYRTLRTRLLHPVGGHAPETVLVTSPGRGDGKTQTTLCLGLTMAQERERRVCVLEADLRHPRMSELLGLPPGPGLADVLTGEASLDEALVDLEDQGLSVLAAGAPGGAAHPAELLDTPAMARLLQTLRTRFDRIVVDAPAAAPLADVALLAPLVDGVVLVVRAGSTTTPAIHEAIDRLADERLMGLVLNDIH
ncbi:MAG: CpsD/CapB family tyrosine-protein kinase [Vicinamibacterales bacterium]